MAEKSLYICSGAGLTDKNIIPVFQSLFKGVEIQNLNDSKFFLFKPLLSYQNLLQALIMCSFVI